MFVLAFGLNFSAGATTWRVNNAVPGADFATLDAALSGITAGDTLYLEGSQTAYTLAETGITKKVTIIGPGYFLTENPNTLERQSAATISSTVNIKPAAAGTVIEGVTFYNSSLSSPIYIGADNVILRRCCIQESVSFSDGITGSTHINNTVITQCYITSAVGGSSTDTNDQPYNALITKNIFLNLSSSNLSYLYNATIEHNTIYNTYASINYLYGCVIQNNIMRTIGTTTTGSSINNNVTFTSADFATGTSDGQYQLKADSPAKIAGTNGVECGAFGGVSPYVLSGLPDIPHIYDIDAPTTASAASGLQVIIKVGTEK
ncbi:hypothetical protein FACS189430_00910 [Bacteroidia bacterium]|nr:hypothetical protein FACS189430_00910 [Bacteroidia bacterium]